ncbi:hypothetical protein PILCRDRAFT_576304 [Piloderma croceum F 1598]|uniref:Uncharacterized protein n=1 Tax=Piloderma croceum (strain F 1598) TaxID=765440 RepID=A0A0C3BND6_PILCF|nr:hypothetical protein PILCRDRAFT_576304 [Piloderma croceum F 1598]
MAKNTPCRSRPVSVNFNRSARVRLSTRAHTDWSPICLSVRQTNFRHTMPLRYVSYAPGDQWNQARCFSVPIHCLNLGLVARLPYTTPLPSCGRFRTTRFTACLPQAACRTFLGDIRTYHSIVHEFSGPPPPPRPRP